MRVVDRAREGRLDPLALRDRVAQLARAQLRDMSVVALAERGRRGFGLLDVSFDARVVT